MNWGREKWRKLYVREEGTFAQLPLFARALAGEILKLVDDSGVIEIGGHKSLEEVIAWRLGATRSDRRMLRLLLPLLFADGYLHQEGDTIRVCNFQAAQSRPRPGNEAATTEQRTDNEPTTNRPRPGNDGVTTESRPSNETRVKTAELFETGRVVEIRSEEKRRDPKSAEEKKSGEAASPPSPPPPPVLEYPCAGSPKTWGLTQGQIEIWAPLYPALDLETECRKALAWVLADPVNRKTAGGMSRFLLRWFGREQNSGNRSARGSPPGKPRDPRFGSVPHPGPDFKYPEGRQPL